VQCDSLTKAPAQIEAFAPSADQMRAHFASLVLAMMPHSTKSPAAPFEESPFEESILDSCALSVNRVNNTNLFYKNV
jgi:hypothetical protein